MLYHYKVYMPSHVSTAIGELVRRLNYQPLRYSRHFMSKLEKFSDRTRRLVLSKVNDWLDDASVIEVEVIQGELTKLLFRVELTSQFDLVFALNSDKTLITCYLNSVADAHKTLDIAKYVKGE